MNAVVLSIAGVFLLAVAGAYVALIAQEPFNIELASIIMFWFFCVFPAWSGFLCLKLAAFNSKGWRVSYPAKPSRLFLGICLVVFAPLLLVLEELVFSLLINAWQQGFTIAMVLTILIVLIPISVLIFGSHLVVSSLKQELSVGR